MKAFAYASPSSLADAFPLLGSNWGATEVMAGGTDLISLMKENVAMPDRVVNIKKIHELEGIRETKEGLRIGALVKFEELEANKTVAADYPALHQAIREVASPQIRNMGTIGGNLCQRPRCWYYRAGFGLLARDAQGKSLVPDGDNRYHAIFGNSGPAYFVSPSTVAPVWIALGAKLRIAGPGGVRVIPVEKFFVIPKNENEREHAIEPNEIITEVVIPSSARGLRSATYEVRQKEQFDWPLAMATVALRMKGDTVESARIVMGHVAPIPWPATDAEQWLAGKSLNEANAAQAAEAAVAKATPLSRNRYKVQLARVAVKRALLAAAAHHAAAAAKGGE